MMTSGSGKIPAFAACVALLLLLAGPVFAAEGGAPAAEMDVPDAAIAAAPAAVPAAVVPALSPAAQPTAIPATGTGVRDYVLGVGDKINITVFNEKDLSGDFEVSSTGIVSMPLIGDVQAAHQTVAQLQKSITDKLANGYMRNPHVSVEVTNYRPFFILGEVMKPGSYNYVNGMSVVTAVALAGGYTYRADKDDITVKHAGAGTREESAQETTTVLPGDVINVPERYF